jgi:hypothetical protein
VLAVFELSQISSELGDCEDLNGFSGALKETSFDLTTFELLKFTETHALKKINGNKVVKKTKLKKCFIIAAVHLDHYFDPLSKTSISLRILIA